MGQRISLQPPCRRRKALVNERAVKLEAQLRYLALTLKEPTFRVKAAKDAAAPATGAAAVDGAAAARAAAAAAGTTMVADAAKLDATTGRTATAATATAAGCAAFEVAGASAILRHKSWWPSQSCV